MEISRVTVYSTIFRVTLGFGLSPEHPGPLGHLPQSGHLLVSTAQDMTSHVSTLSGPEWIGASCVFTTLCPRQGRSALFFCSPHFLFII